MISVKEVRHEGLQHEFAISVSPDEIEQAITRRLDEMGKTAKMQGFRPGKVPLAVLRQRYGAAVREDVIEKKISEGAAKAMNERNLRPAVQPKVNDLNAEEGKDVSFTLSVQVLPEIVPADYSKFQFEKLVAEVDESEIDDTIHRLARTVREPEKIGEPRAAQMGDVVMIDFEGTVDGTAFPGMKGEDHKLELGSHAFVGTFEDQLAGTKAGGKKTVTVQFPDDYHAAHLAGKTAVFEVAVKEILAHKTVTMDDDLAKEIGAASLADLRQRIAGDYAARYATLSRAVLKRQLMDKLAETHGFPIPGDMLEAEFNAIWQQVMKEKAQGRLPEEDAGKSEDELRAEYRGIAERRIRLGLVLADAAQRGKIEVSQTDLRNAMLAEARRFPGQEKAVIDYYLKTEGALDKFRAPILEEKAVDYILAQSKISDKTVPARELLKQAEAD